MNRVVKCTLDEFNEHLKYCKRNRYIMYSERKPKMLGVIANIIVNRVNIRLTYKKPGVKLTTYVFRLDGEIDQNNQGQVAYRTLSHYFKEATGTELDIRDKKYTGYKTINKTVNKGKSNEYTEKSYKWDSKIGSARAILYYNDKFNNQRTSDCYGYDLNSAFTAAMLNDMPDTSKEPKMYARVKKGQIGFTGATGEFKAVFEGYATYVFDLMPSPFKRFAETWYSRKLNAKTPEEKAKAKHMLNDAVGYLQIVNPFMRAAIITYSNKFIQNLIDENTLYCNTDSIVSKTRRLDIEKTLGTGLGEWKIEHTGDFAYMGFTYQWNRDIPKWRGVPKKAFKENFDLLTDTIDSVNIKLKYCFDDKKIKIIERG